MNKTILNSILILLYCLSQTTYAMHTPLRPSSSSTELMQLMDEFPLRPTSIPNTHNLDTHNNDTQDIDTLIEDLVRAQLPPPVKLRSQPASPTKRKSLPEFSHQLLTTKFRVTLPTDLPTMAYEEIQEREAREECEESKASEECEESEKSDMSLTAHEKLVTPYILDRCLTRSYFPHFDTMARDISRGIRPSDEPIIRDNLATTTNQALLLAVDYHHADAHDSLYWQPPLKEWKDILCKKLLENIFRQGDKDKTLLKATVTCALAKCLELGLDNDEITLMLQSKLCDIRLENLGQHLRTQFR